MRSFNLCLEYIFSPLSKYLLNLMDLSFYLRDLRLVHSFAEWLPNKLPSAWGFLVSWEIFVRILKECCFPFLGVSLVLFLGRLLTAGAAAGVSSFSPLFQRNLNFLYIPVQAIIPLFSYFLPPSIGGPSSSGRAVASCLSQSGRKWGR